MDGTNEFDKKLELMRKFASRGADAVDHGHTLDAAVYVFDTLELCLAAARSLPTAKDVTLDHVIAIYDRIEQRRARLADAAAEGE